MTTDGAPKPFGAMVAFVVLLAVVLLKGLALVNEQHHDSAFAAGATLPFLGTFGFVYAFLLHAAKTQDGGPYLPGGTAGGVALALGLALGLYDPARLGIALLALGGAGFAVVAIGARGLFQARREPPPAATREDSPAD